MSKYRVAPLFASHQNSSITCPHCGIRRKLGLILKENMIIGSSQQLYYKDIYEQDDADDLLENKKSSGDKSATATK